MKSTKEVPNEARNMFKQSCEYFVEVSCSRFVVSMEAIVIMLSKRELDIPFPSGASPNVSSDNSPC